MKKTHLFTLFTLILITAFFGLAGCSKADSVSSISLKDHDPNSAIEMAVGEFDYDSYTLLVSYTSGNTEELALNEEMIEQADLFKFYQVGEHEITVLYGVYKCEFKISVKRSTFGELTLPENNVFTYDGTAHTIEVQGDLPADAIVNYPAGNSFINAGTYDVTAIISCEGYVTVKLSTTVKIERAKYDMSNILFEEKEYVYDGNTHSVAISGTLPEGVTSPTYTINGKVASGAIDAGEYTVRATFSNKDPNYETIPDMVTTLKIKPASLTVSGIDLVFKNKDGKVINGEGKVYDGSSVSFDLNDYSKLSKKITPTFFVYDAEGKLISASNKITNIENAGIYTVKVEFTLADNKNYEPIEPLVRTFEVQKAEFPALDGIELVSTQVTYDGTAYSLKIEGNLPTNVKVSYEYYLNNTLIVDADGKPVQSVTDAGRYNVKAVFEHTDANRKPIEPMSAVLNIERIKINVANLEITMGNSVEYNGTPYELNFKTWKEANGSNFEILKYSAVEYYVLDSESGEYVKMGEDEKPTEVGTYKFLITLTVMDEFEQNYHFRNGITVQIVSEIFSIVSGQD